MTDLEKALVIYDGNNDMPYCDLVWQALKEKRDRDKRCDHCRLGIKTIGMQFPTTHEYGGTWWTKTVRIPKFCPMCGRELPSK
jgi:hypothetical protein